MKRFIIVSLTQLLVFLVPFSDVIAAEPKLSLEARGEDYVWGKRDGHLAADTTNTGALNWGANGFFGGALLGPIGASIAVIASHSHPKVPEVYQSGLNDHTQPYRDGFAEGYKQAVNRKALTYSIVGGVIGTAVLAVIMAGVIKRSLRWEGML